MGRRGLRSSSGRGVALGIVGSPVGRSPGCPADAGRGREGTGASADVPIGRIRFTGEPCTLGRVADGELAFATDSGCWPTKVLAVEPSGPLVCRVTDASV